MNNSKLAIERVGLHLDKEIDTKPMLRKRGEELVEIIEALDSLKGSNYWKLINDRIFSKLLDRLHKEIDEETDTIKIFRLQGEIKWAKRYSDLSKLSEEYRNELSRINKQI